MSKEKEIKFEGGPIALHSGGYGPDDYLLRKIGTKKWFLVIFRWGRHFPGSGRLLFGDELAQAKAAVDSDKAAQLKIFPIKEQCVSQNAFFYKKLSESNTLLAMNATEFYERFGG